MRFFGVDPDDPKATMCSASTLAPADVPPTTARAGSARSPRVEAYGRRRAGAAAARDRGRPGPAPGWHDGRVRRRLVVARHAKSDWPAGVADHDRPLGRRGRRDAEAAGRW